jgi:stage V sporulation protein R
MRTRDGAGVRTIIEDVAAAAEAAGLKPCDVDFELVPARLLQTLTAYGGILTRYRHWHFGKAFSRLRLLEQHHLTRMYELVVNSVPAQAYLLDTGTPAEHLVVVAHVLAHVDFFRQHLRLRSVPADMPVVMGWTRDRFQEWSRRLGGDRLEQLLDDGLVVADLLDPYRTDWQAPANVLGFIAHESAVLEPEERAVLMALEREARYFRPQWETKMANEGWATFWHLRLVRGMELDLGTAIEVARLHAEVVAPGATLNPYRLGLALWTEVGGQGEEVLWRERTWATDQGLVAQYLTPAAAAFAGLSGESFPTVKQDLLRRLDNAGLPRVVVADAAPGDLTLRHLHDGRDLEWRDLPGAMAAVGRLWGGRCHLVTVRGGHARRVTWTGRELTEESL